MTSTRLFSADRRGFYDRGALTLHPQNPLPAAPAFLSSHRSDFEAEDIAEHVKALFPDGLSLHGWTFISLQHQPIMDSEEWWVASSPTIELVFEYVRRASYPDRPSRLQSYFAFDSADRVRSFSEKPVYELFSEVVFRADQTWLNVAHQFAVASYNAHQYWMGNASGTPDWEYLLKAPATVVQKL